MVVSKPRIGCLTCFCPSCEEHAVVAGNTRAPCGCSGANTLGRWPIALCEDYNAGVDDGWMEPRRGSTETLLVPQRGCLTPATLGFKTCMPYGQTCGQHICPYRTVLVEGHRATPECISPAAFAVGYPVPTRMFLARGTCSPLPFPQSALRLLWG